MFTTSHGSVLVNHAPPKKEPEFAATDGEGIDAGDTCNIGIDANDNDEYGSPKEEPKSECIDIYYHPLKEEPEPELGDGDGDAVNGNWDCDPPEEKPDLVAAGDDADGDRDVGYDCPHCGISLSTRKSKVEHELRCKVLVKRKELESQVTKLYQCGYCRCPFVNKEYKEQHQRRCRKRPVVTRKDSNGTYFECDKCKFVTKYKINLKNHVLTHNKNNAEWFTCTQCSYKSVRKHSIDRHMKIHSNTFNCRCPICGKSFRTKQSLDDHLVRQHYDESDEYSKLITSRIYTCNICHKYRTILKTNFNEHLSITHLRGVGRPKFECALCPYSTFTKGSLTKHSKTHADQKDYRCAVCKKQFRQKMHLDSHILCIHADNLDLVKTITQKIHRCQSCSFKSVMKSNLKRHVRSKHI